MMDRNETSKKSFAEIWMDGFRQTAEEQAKAESFFFSPVRVSATHPRACSRLSNRCLR